jgi:hypothetical protein
MLVVRITEGLVLAVLLPLCFARIRRSDRASAVLAGVYAIYTILPLYERWQAWCAALISVLCAPLVRRRALGEPRPAAKPAPQVAQQPATETSLPENVAAAENEAAHPVTEPVAGSAATVAGESAAAPRDLRVRTRAAGRALARSPYPLPLLPAVFGAVSVGGFGLWRALWRAACDDRLAVVVNGVAASVFVGGLVTGVILRRFSSVTANRAQAVLGAGTLLGWLERMLYFSFLLAGQPTAAAFALTAKSAARFPALQRDEEGLAEYYLIGSLSSLVLAVVAALLTRLALGMGAV